MLSNTIKGSDGVIKIKEESSYGEFAQDGYVEVLYNTFGVSYSQNEVDSPTMRRGRTPSEKSLGDITVEGDIEIPLDDKFSHYFLKNVFGNYEMSVDGSKNVHTYTIGNSLNSLAVEKSFDGTNVNYLLRGLKLGSLSIETGNEGQLNASIGVLGKSEELRYIGVDAKTAVVVAGTAGSSILDVNDVSAFNLNDKITIALAKGTTVEEAKAGGNLVELDVSNGDNFEKGDLIQIDSIPYVIKAVNDDAILLNKGLEKDVISGTDVCLVNKSYTILAIDVDTNTLTLDDALTDDSFGDIVYGQADAQDLKSEVFRDGELTFTSTDGSVFPALIQKVSFSLDNGVEGYKTINSRGSYGLLLEGKANVNCDLELIFGVENHKFLEDAKIGKTFDLTISATNANGNTLSIHMGEGKLTPSGPSIEGNGAITLSASFSAFGSDISATLKNEETY